ncbi:MAG: O-antigen ligase family protein [Terriglobia bacterium]
MVPVRVQYHPEPLEELLLPGTGVVLAFAALSFGATPFWARGVVELSVLALVGLWWAAGALRGELRCDLPALFFPMLAIFLLACLQAYAGLSAYPPATRAEVWELFAVGAFFLLLHNQLSSPERLERFTTGLLLFAAVLAVFGILQSVSFNGKLYWTWELPQGGTPFGPFINRNHYAAWVLLLVPLAWVKLARRHPRRELQFFWGLVLFLLGLSIMLSRSRAGTLLFVLGLLLAWFFGRRRRSSGRLSMWLPLGLILLAALATLALDTGKVVSRWGALSEAVAGTEEGGRHRWQMWRDTGGMIADHLWLGSGLETFGVLSDSYRSFYSNRQWLRAHNDYLQWLAETGLVGGTLAVWFLVVFARTAAEKLRLAHQDPRRRLCVGAFVGCLLVLLHSLVDFPLRVPANALLFAALLAVLSAPVALKQTPSHRRVIEQAEFRQV